MGKVLTSKVKMGLRELFAGGGKPVTRDSSVAGNTNSKSERTTAGDFKGVAGWN
jgi:hypothetical protein